jgi:hypothetical protein|tara:strand:+ start:135 stop:440 length:306 start_codon:yes stop_codon:yes gene_type:complete
MLCPVCETNCSQVSEDLFDCDACEVRWVLQSDEDFEYLESEGESSSRVSRRDLLLLTMGAVVGVFSGVVGELLAELFLDRLRIQPELSSSIPLDETSETPQ